MATIQDAVTQRAVRLQEREVNSAYRMLAAAIAINTVIMYFVMYTMIDRVEHFYFNVNQLYMVLMMAAPMVLVMLILMRPMYANARLNGLLHAAFAVVLVASFLCMRAQTAVGNEQFLRAMIPHHSGAILMCERAPVSDPEIVALCGSIVETQRKEIAQMETLLARYE